jgi:hypothetical protein
MVRNSDEEKFSVSEWDRCEPMNLDSRCFLARIQVSKANDDWEIQRSNHMPLLNWLYDFSPFGEVDIMPVVGWQALSLNGLKRELVVKLNSDAYDDIVELCNLKRPIHDTHESNYI